MNKLANDMLKLAKGLVAREERFSLKDYLQPGGSRPYRALAGDLEAALAKGSDVALIDVPGFRMVSGYADMADGPRPWSANRKWYKSAKDAIQDRGGRN